MSKKSDLRSALPKSASAAGNGEATGYLLFFSDGEAHMWFVVDGVWRILENATTDTQNAVNAGFTHPDVYEVNVAYTDDSPSLVTQVLLITRKLG